MLQTDATTSWSRHQKLQEEEGNLSLLGISLIWCCKILVTAPEIASGVPLQVCINVYVLTSKSVLQSSTELARVGYIYIYIYMYSGFVYFSLCCASYNVSPLMGQVLGKVLLTSWEIY